MFDRALPLVLAVLSWCGLAVPRADADPIRIAVVGLIHDHARMLLPMLAGRTDFKLVGVVESDPALVDYYVQHYNLDRSLFFRDLDAFLDSRKVDAVATFTTTADHLRVVEACAAHGVDVMMEKPLSVSLADGEAIAKAAGKGRIQVVVNYETTWYPSNQLAGELVAQGGSVGTVRKILVQDGHQGPEAIGVSRQFLGWLSDPSRGGGAMLDFGCYGADLATWLMGSKRPDSVFALLQNHQPTIYKNVEDECTIVLGYRNSQVIIQASWNWPYGRKDMEIYGDKGALLLPDRDTVLYRKRGSNDATSLNVPAPTPPYHDQLDYLAAVVRGKIVPEGLSAVSTNLIVAQILDAARESARSGRQVLLTQAE